jgi:rhamnogalacturonyl hydrolase YesR
MLEDDIKLFGDVEITDKMRQKAFDAISKPIYRDPETGEYYTAVQKYELDNSEEFLAKIGFIYAITDGFKTIDGLVNKKVKKEVKKGFSDLENKLNTTKRDSFGNLRFTSGASSEDSILSTGLKLDL